MKQIKFNVTPEFANKLAAVADEHGLSVASMARMLVYQGLEELEEKEEREKLVKKSQWAKKTSQEKKATWKSMADLL